MRRAIGAAGAKLFFSPPYSPDLNPIEQVFKTCPFAGIALNRIGFWRSWRISGAVVRTCSFQAEV